MTEETLLYLIDCYKQNGTDKKTIIDAVRLYSESLTAAKPIVSGAYPVEECIEAAQRYADGKMMDGYPAECEKVMIDAHQFGQLFLRNKFNIELDYGV